MSKIVLMSVVVLFALSAQPVFADEAPAAAVEQAKELVNVGNKICPVSGEKIEPSKMGDPVTYEYNGKIYNLCCGMCTKDFKKDPEKYSKIAEDEVAAAQAK